MCCCVVRRSQSFNDASDGALLYPSARYTGMFTGSRAISESSSSFYPNTCNYIELSELHCFMKFMWFLPQEVFPDGLQQWLTASILFFAASIFLPDHIFPSRIHITITTTWWFNSIKWGMQTPHFSILPVHSFHRYGQSVYCQWHSLVPSVYLNTFRCTVISAAHSG